MLLALLKAEKVGGGGNSVQLIPSYVSFSETRTTQRQQRFVISLEGSVVKIVTMVNRIKLFTVFPYFIK